MSTSFFVDRNLLKPRALEWIMCRDGKLSVQKSKPLGSSLAVCKSLRKTDWGGTPFANYEARIGAYAWQDSCQLVCELASRTICAWACHAPLTFMGKPVKGAWKVSAPITTGSESWPGEPYTFTAMGAVASSSRTLRIEDFPPLCQGDLLAAATSKTVSVIARDQPQPVSENPDAAHAVLLVSFDDGEAAIVDPTWPQASYNIERNKRDKVWKTLRGPGPVAEVVKGYRDPADAGKVTQWPNAPHPEDFADPQGKMEVLLDQVVDAAFTRQCEVSQAGALAAEGRQGQ
ncbi:MAG: hypothetical protein ACPGR8_11800 [Limisphaerales bacterium]